MAKARAIIKRRKAVKNIAKITKTMNMIASSRFQRAFKRAVAARPFTDKLREVLADLVSAGLEYSHPLTTPHETDKKTLIFIVTSNRGLCGGYNSNILREAAELYRTETAAGRQAVVEIAGKRGVSWARFAGHTVRTSYTQFDDRPRFEQVEPVAKSLIDAFLSGEFDRVYLVYMKFHSAGRQTPITVPLLPVQPQAVAAGAKPVETKGPRINYTFLPDAAGLMDELIPQSIKANLFQSFLDAAVSEQVARMIAMKAATDNATELVQQLTMRYNRARQSQITTELSEIMGGAAALSG